MLAIAMTSLLGSILCSKTMALMHHPNTGISMISQAQPFFRSHRQANSQAAQTSPHHQQDSISLMKPVLVLRKQQVPFSSIVPLVVVWVLNKSHCQNSLTSSSSSSRE